MKVSIAMATYNGARYLQEQLDSFVTQTRPPDELVVCDDCSSDATIDILESFRRGAPFDVRITRNSTRFGYSENFGRAISRCDGDIIFLSDQDDVWLSGKIDTVCHVFEENPGLLVVVNDAELTDKDLNRNGLTVAGQILAVGRSVSDFNFGCCISFRSKMKPLIIPSPLANGGHDGWINTIGVMLNSRIFVANVLQYYRRHDTNASNTVVNSSTSKLSHWHLLKEKLKTVSLTDSPLNASDRRLHQLSNIKDTFTKNRSYILDNLVSDVCLDDAISRLDLMYKSNEVRRAIQQNDFPMRAMRATKFYLAGGYRDFDSFKSFLRDLFR